MRRSWLCISMVFSLGAAAGWAEAPAANEAAKAGATPSEAGASQATQSQAAAWDDSHMQSRYQTTPPTTRPRISGESGYGALASGSSETRTAVGEAVEFSTQRQWKQGALTPSAQPPSDASAGSDRNHTPGISRGSALRAGSVSSGRRRN